MKTAILMTACLASALSAGFALAGPCTSEIDGLTKTMSTKDAGSGPTSGAMGTTATTQSQASQGQHPPTAIMDREARGKATSPDDVRRQTEGRPTASGQANANAPGGAKLADASAALARAKELDALGREAECMEAVRNARTLAGS